jgi:hypothetical protein
MFPMSNQDIQHASITLACLIGYAENTIDSAQHALRIKLIGIPVLDDSVFAHLFTVRRPDIMLAFDIRRSRLAHTVPVFRPEPGQLRMDLLMKLKAA